MITSTLLLAIPLMAILTVIQTAVLPYFPLLGVTPSLPFLVALAWSLLRGANEGFLWAFVAGVFMDLFTAAPVGGLALTYMLAIFAVALVKERLPSNRTLIPMLLAAAATFIQQLLYAAYLALFGYSLVQVLSYALLPMVILHTFLVLPIYWLLYFVQNLIWPKPVEV